MRRRHGYKDSRAKALAELRQNNPESLDRRVAFAAISNRLDISAIFASIKQNWAPCAFRFRSGRSRSRLLRSYPLLRGRDVSQ